VVKKLFFFGLAALSLFSRVASAAPVVGNAAAGKAVFALCADCHEVGPRAHGGFAPQLTGVIGRRAGSTKDYHYSAAMKNSGIVWSPKTLAAFLKSPGDVVPGTKMSFYGLSDERKIADLLAYLGSFQAAP
jgi:cytochrome c